MAPSLSALLLFIGTVGYSSAVTVSSTCSVDIDITYPSSGGYGGTEPFVRCNEFCEGDEERTYFDGVAYQRLEYLTEEYNMMIKIEYRRGYISRCYVEPFESVDDVAVRNQETEECVARTSNSASVQGAEVVEPSEPEVRMGCPEDFISLGDSCYTLSTGPLNRGKARNFCKGKGAILAKIDSQEEQDALASILDDHVFIGVNDVAEEGVFKNLDGTLATYFNWNAGEPNNNRGAENCVVMRANKGFRWNDVSCFKSFLALCETAMVPLTLA